MGLPFVSTPTIQLQLEALGKTDLIHDTEDDFSFRSVFRRTKTVNTAQLFEVLCKVKREVLQLIPQASKLVISDRPARLPNNLIVPASIIVDINNAVSASAQTACYQSIEDEVSNLNSQQQSSPDILVIHPKRRLIQSSPKFPPTRYCQQTGNRKTFSPSFFTKCCICPTPSAPPWEDRGGRMSDAVYSPVGVGQPKSKPAMFTPAW